MKVPSKDYRRQYEALWPEVEAALRRCFFEDAPVLGAAVGRFERALAAYHEVRCCVGTGSGTAAATLLYRALEIGPGDAVITGARTFPGVISAIALAGARPVVVDCDPVTGRLRSEAVAEAWRPEVKAVMVAHLYGHAEAADALGALCAERGAPLLEDTAQAHGARWRGRPVGGFGRAAITSFHPSKNLGAFGDAGAILTDDEALAARLRILGNLGKGGKYRFDAVGPNTKLDTLQAALLEVKLAHLDGWLARRRAIAGRYLDGLAEAPGLTLPPLEAACDPAWHLFVVRSPQRDALRTFLAEAGVRAGLHYPIPLRDHPAFEALLDGQATPHADQWAREVLTLPLSHEHTDGEIDHVIEQIWRWGRCGG